MASPLNLLAAVTLTLIAIARFTTAHYTKISNSCAKIQISGTISEATWRESRPIRAGTVNTESDTTAHVKTNFGEVTVNLWDKSSSIVTNLNTSLVKEATFNGLLGLQNAQASNTISCSPHIYGGCKDNIGMDTPRAGDPPTYAELQFSC